MARMGQTRHVDLAVRACIVIGTVITTAVGAAPLHSGTAATDVVARDLLIASPRPFFMQLSGQGPAMSASRIVWTAINGQGQAGAQADRIYIYDLEHGAYSTPIYSQYGAAGFIGAYTLAGA